MVQAMNKLLLLHGAVGNLDELLVCGIGLAILLLIVFVVEVRARKNESAIPETTENDQAH